ncbi:MAG: hypothetical protein R2939_07560 [Kofleriaceae bacterium]
MAVDAEPGADALRAGTPATRELEQGCGFLGARLATSGAGFDVAAVVAVRDAAVELAPPELHAPLARLFEWLTVIALDAFAAAGRRAVEERAIEELELGTPVYLATPDVPAVMLVGEPPRATLDSIFGRVLLAVIAASARSLVVDVSGLAAPGRPELLAAVDAFLGSDRLAAVEVQLVGVSGEVRRRWQAMAAGRGVGLAVHDRFEAALAAALERAGTQLRRRA